MENLDFVLIVKGRPYHCIPVEGADDIFVGPEAVVVVIETLDDASANLVLAQGIPAGEGLGYVAETVEILLQGESGIVAHQSQVQVSTALKRLAVP